ncbi:MAG TPA: helix-turn-helix transcriptional regulator, partial [Rubrobacteraceae bacterium]|nr:helix-turn-helix transcriptional regulator [Rubrobacteraceae bacterium]
PSIAPDLCYNPIRKYATGMEVDVGRLKELRRLRAYSQQDLADAAGVGRNTISRIERGETGAHGRTLRRLAEALRVDVAELVKSEEG